jgi:hypothetical protein
MNRRGFLAAGAAARALPAGAATAARGRCHGGARTAIAVARGLGHRMIARETTTC